MGIINHGCNCKENVQYNSKRINNKNDEFPDICKKVRTKRIHNDSFPIIDNIPDEFQYKEENNHYLDKIKGNFTLHFNHFSPLKTCSFHLLHKKKEQFLKNKGQLKTPKLSSTFRSSRNKSYYKRSNYFLNSLISSSKIEMNSKINITDSLFLNNDNSMIQKKIKNNNNLEAFSNIRFFSIINKLDEIKNENTYNRKKIIFFEGELFQINNSNFKECLIPKYCKIQDDFFFVNNEKNKLSENNSKSSDIININLIEEIIPFKFDYGKSNIQSFYGFHLSIKKKIRSNKTNRSNFNLRNIYLLQPKINICNIFDQKNNNKHRILSKKIYPRNTPKQISNLIFDSEPLSDDDLFLCENIHFSNNFQRNSFKKFIKLFLPTINKKLCSNLTLNHINTNGNNYTNLKTIFNKTKLNQTSILTFASSDKKINL